MKYADEIAKYVDHIAKHEDEMVFKMHALGGGGHARIDKAET